MAKSLQEILSPKAFEPILKMMLDAPVHRLENVDGDPKRVRVVCRPHLAWEWPTATKLVSEMEQVQPVTCPKCLVMMADEPIVVDVDWDGKPVRRVDDGGTLKP